MSLEGERKHAVLPTRSPRLAELPNWQSLCQELYADKSFFAYVLGLAKNDHTLADDARQVAAMRTKKACRVGRFHDYPRSAVDE